MIEDSYNSKRQTYMKSDKWKHFSKIVKERDGNRCRMCDSSSILEVHHRNYDSLYKEDENDFSDLITLCRNCHNQHHALRNPIKCPPSNLLKIRCRELLCEEIPVLDESNIKEVKKGKYFSEEDYHPKIKVNPIKKVENMPWLPSSSSFSLTEELIDKLRTKNNGFTKQTIKSLNLSYPLKKKWRRKLKKKKVTKGLYIEIYRNKDILSTNSKCSKKTKKAEKL